MLWVLFPLVGFSQGRPFTCCGEDGKFGQNLCNDDGTKGIANAFDFGKCWSNMKVHFASKNATKQNFFIFTLSKTTSIIDFSDAEPVKYDADSLTKELPELGYLPYRIIIQFPYKSKMTLVNLDAEITLHGGKKLKEDYIGLTVYFTGSDRDSHKIQNSKVSSFGFGNPYFSFLTIENSTITSIAPPTRHIQNAFDDTVTFEESTIQHSVVNYFGRVSGDIGNSVGLPQMGSKAFETSFKIMDPRDYLDDYAPPTNSEFAWVADSALMNFTHMENCYVEYTYDLTFGTVRVVDSQFVPVLFDGGVFTYVDRPPGITVYQAEQNLPPYKSYGSILSNCTIEYIWSGFISLSAIENSFIGWTSSLKTFPKYWLDYPQPSFAIYMVTKDTNEGFYYSINDTVICLRDGIVVNGTNIAEQTIKQDDDGHLHNTTISHVDEKLCKRRL